MQDRQTRPNLKVVPTTDSDDEPITHPDILPEEFPEDAPTNPVRVDNFERDWVRFYFQGVDLRRRKARDNKALVNIDTSTHITLHDQAWRIPEDIHTAMKAIQDVPGVMTLYVQLNGSGRHPHWFAVKTSGLGDTLSRSEQIHEIIAAIPLVEENQAAEAS